MKRVGLRPRKHGLQFTSNWVSRHVPTWKKHLRRLKGRPRLQFLEIGSWEGRSACWFLQNILTHPTSRITCIDTFEGSPDELALHAHLRDAIGSIERRFDHNIAYLKARKKVRKIKGSSLAILRTLPLASYDLLYIDGSHTAPDVLIDAVHSWQLLKPGGLMIFDDYRWKYMKKPRNRMLEPKPAIDAFREIFRDHCDVLSVGTQVILRKH